MVALGLSISFRHSNNLSADKHQHKGNLNWVQLAWKSNTYINHLEEIHYLHLLTNHRQLQHYLAPLVIEDFRTYETTQYTVRHKSEKTPDETVAVKMCYVIWCDLFDCSEETDDKWEKKLAPQQKYWFSMPVEISSIKCTVRVGA